MVDNKSKATLIRRINNTNENDKNTSAKHYIMFNFMNDIFLSGILFSQFPCYIMLLL